MTTMKSAWGTWRSALVLGLVLAMTPARGSEADDVYRIGRLEPAIKH